jgi:hypothetical protein
MLVSIRELNITPAIAKDLLEKNTNNRPLSASRVSLLARAMSSGEWQYNGDTIRIAKSGRLLDGQHRLTAIIQSGKAQKQIVVDELDDETFTTIDTGAGRNPGQMLAMAGEKNANCLAATARLVLCYNVFGRPVHGSPDKKPSHTSIVEFAEGCSELKESVRISNNKWLKSYMGASVAAFAHYVFGERDEQKRDDFFEEIVSGEFSYRDSPLRFVRDLLIEERGASYRPDKMRRIGMIFKAFRLYRKGKTAKIVRLEKDPNDWFKL